MTETSPVSFQTQTTDPLVKRIETVGMVLPHVDAMVASPDSPLDPLPVNTPGELFVSGYLVRSFRARAGSGLMSSRSWTRTGTTRRRSAITL
jgi:hypothetical protein